jgi:hypothetical protein
MLFGQLPAAANRSTGLHAPWVADVEVFKWVLIALVVALEIADIATTNHVFAIDSTAWELNPVMAWCMGNLGALWWLPKLAVIGFAILAVRRLPVRGYMAATLLNVAIVASNLASF